MNQEEKRESKRRATKKYKAAHPDRVKKTKAETRKKHIEANHAYAKVYREAHKEESREKASKYHKAHPTRTLAYSAKWREANLEKAFAQIAKWRKENPDKLAAISASRRAKEAHAKCSWANKFFIDEIYRLAKLRTKLTGIEWEVDHIVPIKSKYVCGLHNEFNLRVIPKLENRSKGNRYWPDMALPV